MSCHDHWFPLTQLETLKYSNSQFEARRNHQWLRRRWRQSKAPSSTDQAHAKLLILTLKLIDKSIAAFPGVQITIYMSNYQSLSNRILTSATLLARNSNIGTPEETQTIIRIMSNGHLSWRHSFSPEHMHHLAMYVALTTTCPQSHILIPQIPITQTSVPHQIEDPPYRIPSSPPLRVRTVVH